jgi:hypothetical protein
MTKAKRKNRASAEPIAITLEEWQELKAAINHIQIMQRDMVEIMKGTTANIAHIILRMDDRDGKPVNPVLLRAINNAPRSR